MVKEQALSRRGLLSIICSVYDPMGFLAPVTLPAKVTLQELCWRCWGWDDNIPVDINHQWTGWLEDLKRLASFKVERCTQAKHFGQPIKAQLHNFSDASEDGFFKNSKSQVHVSFLLGTPPPETDNHSSCGAYSCCPRRSSRSDVESRIGAAIGSVNFLVGQYFHAQVHKKWGQTFPHICGELGVNNQRCNLRLSEEVYQYQRQSSWLCL